MDTRCVGPATVKSDCSVLERIVFSGTIVLAIAILYGPSIYYGYLFDDFKLLNITISDVFNYSCYGIHVRPVWYLSLYLTNLFGHSSVLDHATNLILFLIACALGFKVASKFLGQERKAFIVTLIWIVVPWNSFSVMWISERNDLLVEIFAFLALLSMDRKNYTRSLVSVILALFSKVTAMFLPVYFIFKTYRMKAYAYTIMFTVAMISCWILAARAVVMNFSELSSQGYSYKLEVNLVVRLIIWCAHYFEALIVQFLPLPYFLNPWFLGLYLIGVIGLSVFVFFDIRKVNKDAILLALLCAGPGFMYPELRILSLSSFFIIVAIVSSYARIKNKMGFVISVAMIMSFFCLGIFVSRSAFNTRAYDLTQDTVYWQSSTGGYLNNYYEGKKTWLINLYNVVFHNS
jgi:hypothetical protein